MTQSSGAMRYTPRMEPLLIVVTGPAVWLPELDGRDMDIHVVRYGEKPGYVPRLADDHAALILVDAADPDWAYWATTPKVSPATRRIPVVVVGGETVQSAAESAGADAVVAPGELAAALPALLADIARATEAESAERLAAQCAEPLPPEAREAVRLFNEGAYYKQHDAFEALWMAEEGPVRELYRAILQVGIAYYQVTLGNRRGALKMLLRAVQWLNVLPDVCQGVDVARLRADAARVRAALDAAPEGDDLSGFDRSLLGGVHLVE